MMFITEFLVVKMKHVAFATRLQGHTKEFRCVMVNGVTSFSMHFSDVAML